MFKTFKVSYVCPPLHFMCAVVVGVLLSMGVCDMYGDQVFGRIGVVVRVSFTKLAMCL
jgi:hypothetical protein